MASPPSCLNSDQKPKERKRKGHPGWLQDGVDLTGLRTGLIRVYLKKPRDWKRPNYHFLVVSHLRLLHMWGGWKGSCRLEGVAVEKEMGAANTPSLFPPPYIWFPPRPGPLWFSQTDANGGKEETYLSARWSLILWKSFKCLVIQSQATDSIILYELFDHCSTGTGA